MEGAIKDREDPGNSRSQRGLHNGDAKETRKSQLKEAMKKASEDGKTVNAPLQGAEEAKPGIYVYVYVSVCVCSCIM